MIQKPERDGRICERDLLFDKLDIGRFRLCECDANRIDKSKCLTLRCERSDRHTVHYLITACTGEKTHIVSFKCFQT